MFAGPNGSGKSTIKTKIPSGWLGDYINPDEIQQEIRVLESVNLEAHEIQSTTDEVVSFFEQSDLWKSTGLLHAASHVEMKDGKLVFMNITNDSYIASISADFIRQKLLRQKASFTFETVMSHPDKVALLEKAKDLGYRTYLYYIATEDSAINISRVKYRVEHTGGHSVPEDKITTRYKRSLELLMDAIRHTNRAYIFDNSRDGSDNSILIAEITEGRDIVLKYDPMPAWFKRTVWDKVRPI